jgi:hypothetical protein
MKYLFTIIAVLLLVGLPASAYAQEPAEGIIDGQVVNGTEGGGSVAGVEVTLITYVDDTMSETSTTVADEEGKFQFESIAMEHTYLVSARYMGVGYYYLVAFESGEMTAYVEVGVCDVTESDQAIRAGMVHTMIYVAEDSLEITEVYWLVNDGDTTYVGTDGALVFTLPEGAFGFEAPEELLMDFQLLEDNRIAYLVPFPPGERQIVYAYQLAKPDAAKFSLPLKVDYPTDSLELMVAGEDIEVAVSQLSPAEPVVASTGERYIHFQGKNLPRNTIINLNLSDLSRGGGFPTLILLVIIAVVIIGIVIFLISRRKRAGSGE